MLCLRVAILSDDRVFRDALARLLHDRPGLIVSAADDAVGSLLLESDPHVVIVDGRMPGALAACETLAAASGRSVLLVGAPEEDQWACRALSAGAGGILTKTSHGDDVVSAIHVVHNGGIWAQRRWLRAWMQDATPCAAGLPETSRLDALLSRREREVFHGAALGAANKELAVRLSISEATVKAHLTRIFQKLGVTGRAELAAVYHGLAHPSAKRPAPVKPRTNHRHLPFPIRHTAG